jgi:hypothetical protein
MSENQSKSFWQETKWFIISLAILLVVTLPCCAILGYYTNRILWLLGLR